jgi:hypothetical protein
MMTPTESRRYGLMVRDFTPDEAKAYNDHLLAGKRAEDFFAKMEKHLAGQHDQSSHGSWSSDVFTELNYWEKFNEFQTFYPKDGDQYFEGNIDKQELFEQLLKKIEYQQVEAGYDSSKNKTSRGAMAWYLQSGHKVINDALRDPQISEEQIQDKISAIDKAINDAPPLKDPMLAYRGVANQGLMGSFFFEKLKVGDTFEDKGFVSTTINPKVATGFAGSEKSQNFQGVVLQYHFPKGTKGLFPNAFMNGEYWDESEFMLPRGSKFKVTQIRGKIIDVEIVQ